MLAVGPKGCPGSQGLCRLGACEPSAERVGWASGRGRTRRDGAQTANGMLGPRGKLAQTWALLLSHRCSGRRISILWGVGYARVGHSAFGPYPPSVISEEIRPDFHRGSATESCKFAKFCALDRTGPDWTGPDRDRTGLPEGFVKSSYVTYLI